MKNLLINFFASVIAIVIVLGSIAVCIWAVMLTWSVLTMTAYEMISGHNPTILKWLF